ncbi:hypothetical protein ACROYT_G005280 [Oculina patagonica]
MIPGRTIRVLKGSVKLVASLPYNAVVERIEEKLAELPSGMTVGAAVDTVGSKGKIPIQVANFSTKDVYLNLRTPVAALSTFQLKPTFEFVAVEMDMDNLTGPERDSLQQVSGRYQSSFSKGEDDLGFCVLVEQKVVTTDGRPIKIPHRRVPPTSVQEVRDYIHKSLEQGITRESSRPYASPIFKERWQAAAVCGLWPPEDT